MSERAIIELSETTVKPGGTLTGRVVWRDGGRPDSLELRVFWMTSGRGTEEVNVIATVPGRLEDDGTVAFSIDLPELPWSFDGRLIQVSWAVEVVDREGEACALSDFVLSPDGEVRVLEEVKVKKKSRFGFSR